MKWFDDKKKENKMMKMSESIHSIRSQQVMQYLELIHTSIEGLRDIGRPVTEADKANHDTFMTIFNESMSELQKYADRFKFPELESREYGDYSLNVSGGNASEYMNRTKEVE